MKRKRLLFAVALLLCNAAVWATDYLTDISGYTVTNNGSDATNGNAREFWKSSVLTFDIFQETTSLPNGVYNFSLQAVYRAHRTVDTPTGVIIYAESDGNQYMAPVANYTDGSVSAENLGGFSTAFI